LPTKRILNLAVGGDTSAGLLNRLRDVIGLKPRIAFLMIGVNDFLREDIPVELVATHIRFITVRLAANNIAPVVQSTLYVSNNAGSDLNNRIKALNALLRSWCAENAIIYLDLNNELSMNDELLSRFSYDGVHLNRDAYAVWRRIIKEHVQRLSLDS
jgi:lysophospholipase L1-like esterase